VGVVATEAQECRLERGAHVSNGHPPRPAEPPGAAARRSPVKWTRSRGPGGGEGRRRRGGGEGAEERGRRRGGEASPPCAPRLAMAVHATDYAGAFRFRDSAVCDDAASKPLHAGRFAMGT